MYYCGIDYHKKYSVVSTIDSNGQPVDERRIGHQAPTLFQELFSGLDQPVKVVFENSLNWSWLYEILEQIENVEQIILANPYKVKLISEAQIKTDKIDAGKLAHLLRLDVIPSCHVPSRRMREPSIQQAEPLRKAIVEKIVLCTRKGRFIATKVMLAKGGRADWRLIEPHWLFFREYPRGSEGFNAGRIRPQAAS